MANLYVKAVPPADLNRNTDWFMYPGVWTTYILILFFSWLLVLSLFGCSPGIAWTVVNLGHFLVCSSFNLAASTSYVFHLGLKILSFFQNLDCFREIEWVKINPLAVSIVGVSVFHLVSFTLVLLE